MTVLATRRSYPRRVALLSLHTSPLDQPGTGDAGGLNVYVVEVSKRLAAVGVEVDIFTRATSSRTPARVELAPGVVVQNLPAGPFEGLRKEDLPGELCTFTNGVLLAEAARDAGWYDVVHSHFGSPARWVASSQPAGRSRWYTPCTPWRRSRTLIWPLMTPPSRRFGSKASRTWCGPPPG